jgi:methyl-accepting chemotaxis protein
MNCWIFHFSLRADAYPLCETLMSIGNDTPKDQDRAGRPVRVDGHPVAGSATFTVNRMNAINFQTAEIAGNWMPSLAFAKDADKAFADMKVAWRSHVIASADERITRIEADVMQIKARFEKNLGDYDKIYTYPVELEITKGIRATQVDCYRVGERLRAASRAHDDIVAEQLLFNEMLPLADSISSDLRKLIGSTKKVQRPPMLRARKSTPPPSC